MPLLLEFNGPPASYTSSARRWKRFWTMVIEVAAVDPDNADADLLAGHERQRFIE